MHLRKWKHLINNRLPKMQKKELLMKNQHSHTLMIRILSLMIKMIRNRLRPAMQGLPLNSRKTIKRRSITNRCYNNMKCLIISHYLLSSGKRR